MYVYRTYSNNWDIDLLFKTNDRPVTKIPLPWHFELFFLNKKTYENVDMSRQKRTLFLQRTSWWVLLTLIERNESFFEVLGNYTAQKMKFSIKDFFNKCDQIRRELRNWSHSLKKSLMETSFFVQGAFGITSTPM